MAVVCAAVSPPPGLCARLDFRSLIVVSFSFFSIYSEHGSLGFFYSLKYFNGGDGGDGSGGGGGMCVLL